MKRIISLVLVLVSLLTLSLFCFTSCTINKSEVSILWSGEGETKVPDSLINSMERAMYIENITYKHYGANGDLKKQVEQAEAAVNGGCAVLLVELVQDNVIEGIVAQNAAKEIVDAAKAKNIPVVFFNCTVSDEIVNSYDKCALVKADNNTAVEVQAEIIANYVKKNFNASDPFNKNVKGTDKNKDNKITAISASLNGLYNKEIIQKANEILATDDYKVSRHFLGFLGIGKDINLQIELSNDSFETADLTKYELILTDNDKDAYNALVKLQEKDYNTDKLKEQFVPIITVGNTVDYKAIVLEGRSEIPENLIKKDGDNFFVINDKNSKIRKHFEEYYTSKRFICDLTTVDEYDDVAQMLYTTINVVDSGRIIGTVIADNDGISAAVAKVVKNYISGDDIFQIVSGKIKISYTTHAN